MFSSPQLSKRINLEEVSSSMNQGKYYIHRSIKIAVYLYLML